MTYHFLLPLSQTLIAFARGKSSSLSVAINMNYLLNWCPERCNEYICLAKLNMSNLSTKL